MSFYILFIGLLCMASGTIQAQINPSTIQHLPWKAEKVHPGILWKSVQTNQLFDSKQSIQVIELRKRRTIDLGYELFELKTTSKFAEDAQAKAAINAGFFNMREGGSVTFMKVNDTVINGHRTDRALLTKSCLAINERGKLHIISSGDTALLKDPSNYDDVLFTGPLLVYNDHRVTGHDLSRDQRHPRTCICTRRNNQVLLITVDGRHEEAAGMTIPELTTLMLGLQCQNAINLDGGGSTTMWIDGYGVVNHPSDNKVFDALGERKVANVILVF